jgi:hypothetical protein
MPFLLQKAALAGLMQNNFGLIGKWYKDLRENGIGTCEKRVLSKKKFGLERMRYIVLLAPDRTFWYICTILIMILILTLPVGMIMILILSTLLEMIMILILTNPS